MTAPAAVPGRDERTSVLPLPGLEADNLLAFLALLGLLRSLETEMPDRDPRASWSGPPWIANLHLAGSVDSEQIARAAAKGVHRIAARYDFGSHKNVDFTPGEFREHARQSRTDPVRAALAAALTAEYPEKKGGGLKAGPFVLMFGQGHQNFLERLVSVPLGALPPRLKKEKAPPDFRNHRYIVEALFQPWRRDDDADAFRWDPEEDQRYALRFGDPSRAGAALTVHGANRLAAVGLLSFPCAPAKKDPNAPGTTRDADGVRFVWPIWTEPLSLHSVQRLLCHPDLIKMDQGALAPLGVASVYVARRVPNGKFMNVTRAVPRRLAS